MSGWDTGKPIYDRLPGESELYRKDPNAEDYDPSTDIALWVTKFWDDFLVEQRGNVDNIYRDVFNPDTAKPENLDWLAQLAGFTGEYWSSDWRENVKRQLIKNAYSFIWINKGTRELLEWLIALFNLQAVIYSPGEFILDSSPLDSTIGGEPFYYLIQVDFYNANYLRTSAEWKLLEKLNYLFGTAYSESSVQYSEFILDFSLLGENL